MTSILIIDDAAFSRRMIRKALQAEGYEFLEANDGQEGLEIAKIHKPDCILTDLLMPNMTGFEMIVALRGQGLNIPVIIISADIQDDTREQGFELGASGFINKPLKAVELSATIKQALAAQENHVPCN